VAENICPPASSGAFSFRRAMKKAMQPRWKWARSGSSWRAAGRLGSAEKIARVETSKDGKAPLHTLRANIDYGFAESKTLYGRSA